MTLALAGGISGRVLVRIVDFVAARGHDPDALCHGAGVSLAALREPEARLPYALAEALGERAVAVTGDANLGLHLAHTVRDSGTYDAGVLMLMASPTVRVAMERMVQYQRYWRDDERTTLRPARGGLVVRLAPTSGSAVVQRHSDECAAAEVVLGLRSLASPTLSPRGLRFRHQAPPDTREQAELFRCPIEFAAPYAELEFDDATLDTRMEHANEAYARIFQQQVERALASLPGQSGMADGVRSAARAALTSGDCSLARTARVLGVSARTMQRRLQAEGTSFGEIIDALRRELAHAYLEKQLPVQQIAWLLGYTDASSFHHAFKRWTGTSPEQARAAGVKPRLSPQRVDRKAPSGLAPRRPRWHPPRVP